MIRIKNLADFLVEGEQIGNATTGVKKLWRATFNGIVLAVGMRVRTAGVTGSQIGDCNINGTSVFTTAGNRPTLTTGTDAEATGSTTIDGTRTFSTGDILDLSLDAVHSGTAAVDTSLVVVVRQQPSRGTVNYTE